MSTARALLLRAFALLALVSAIPSAPAVAATRTWDGSVSSAWGVAGNWEENAFPVDGDDLVFPAGAANTTNTNDLVGLDVNSITVSGDVYVIGGNSIVLAAPGITVTSTMAITNISMDISIGATITITISNLVGVTLSGVISGAGGITKTGIGAIFLNGANTYTGVTSINQGSVEVFNATGLGTIAGGTTVASDAALGLFGGIDVGAEPLTINGTGVPMGIPALYANNAGTSFAGNINVASDSTIGAGGSFTVSGVLSGSGALTKTFGDALILTANSAGFTNQMTVNVGTLLVNGQYGGPILVDDITGGFTEAIVGGTGTVGPITVAGFGVGFVAPGVSPGILSSGNLTFTDTDSIFRVELNGTTAGTQYDQLNVTGSVSLANATLQVTVGFVPAVGDTFTIISNDGVDAVAGTFNGLSDGATFMTGGTTMSINYDLGTDLNDVVLTVLETSQTPFSTATGTASRTTTGTPTTTPTDVTTATPTGTPTSTTPFTPSQTPSSTASGTASQTPTVTPTITQTSTITRTPTITETPTITRTPTITQTPTITRTPTITPTPVPTGPGGIGEECSSDSECMTLFCTDGVCCDSRCQGANQSCDTPGRAGMCTSATVAPVMDARAQLLSVVAFLLVAWLRLRHPSRRSE